MHAKAQTRGSVPIIFLRLSIILPVKSSSQWGYGGAALGVGSPKRYSTALEFIHLTNRFTDAISADDRQAILAIILTAIQSQRQPLSMPADRRAR